MDKNKENYENYIINYSSKTQIPLIATNENFFISKNFYSSHDALLAISDQKYIESDDRLKSNAEYYFRSEVEMNEKFSDIPFICDNT